MGKEAGIAPDGILEPANAREHLTARIAAVGPLGRDSSSGAVSEAEVLCSGRNSGTREQARGVAQQKPEARVWSGSTERSGVAHDPGDCLLREDSRFAGGLLVGAHARESNEFRPTPAPSRMFGESRGEEVRANMVLCRWGSTERPMEVR